jgi:hypothetical protein
MKFTLILFCLLISVAGWAQPSASKDAFIELRVEAGQTLYAISKKYNVTVESMMHSKSVKI